MRAPRIITILLVIAVLVVGYGYRQSQKTSHHYDVLDYSNVINPDNSVNESPRVELINSHTSLTTETAVSTTTPQFILFSFDGSKDHQTWIDTLAFARDMRLRDKPISFTYFLNSVYLLAPENKYSYMPFGRATGSSAIGFADSVRDVQARVADINQAINDGHELGSHAAGHFDGSDWAFEQWLHEFDQFNSLLFNVQNFNPTLASNTAVSVRREDIVGFRAPHLGFNEAMYEALAQRGFAYDSSGSGQMTAMPLKDAYGIWRIPLAFIPIGSQGRKVLSMDYNIWMYQTQAKEMVRKGSDEWDLLLDEVVKAYKNYFDTNYSGNRAPVVIGHHFGKWNDGLYWEAMKVFAEEVCGVRDVHCVTYKEYVKFLEGRE